MVFCFSFHWLCATVCVCCCTCVCVCVHGSRLRSSEGVPPHLFTITATHLCTSSSSPFISSSDPAAAPHPRLSRTRCWPGVQGCDFLTRWEKEAGGAGVGVGQIFFASNPLRNGPGAAGGMVHQQGYICRISNRQNITWYISSSARVFVHCGAVIGHTEVIWSYHVCGTES